jgi:5-methylcytosine-specific restriction endonuclease McrA
MKRPGYIQRKTPIRKVRPGTRRGQPTKAEKGDAREVCCNRDGEKCESCGIHLPLELGHLAHEHAKRRFGWQESATNSHRWLCWECHHAEHNPKACAPKAGLK